MKLPIPVHLEEVWFERMQAHGARRGEGCQWLFLGHDRSDSRVEMSQKWVHHDFCSLYIVRQGRGTHVISGVRYSVARGDVYAMSPGMSHYFWRCEELLCDALHFRSELLGEEVWARTVALPGVAALFLATGAQEAAGASEATGEEGARRHWLHLAPADFARVAGQVDELREEHAATQMASGEAASDAAAARVLVPALFLRLLVSLSRCHAARSSENVASAEWPEKHGAAVAAAVRFIDRHFANEVQIEKLARHSHLCTDRFTDVFRAVMGRTPHDYLRHVRLQEATRLLRQPNLAVAQVALQCGFSSPAHFTRTFHKAHGTSPREYRRNLTGQ